MLWVALSVVSVVFFQNCGQQGDIALKMDDDASSTLVQDICAVNPAHVRCTNENPTGKVEEYRYIDVSQPIIPDLKIFLVLDNSDSMRVSQVNLVNNIEKMFNANSAGLRDYNSEIFIITTAQLNNINNALSRSSVNAKSSYQKVIERIYEISSVQYVQSLIEVFRPNAADGRGTTGLLEGDMVGFKAKVVRAPTAADPKYDTLDMNFSPAYVTHVDQSSVVSVKYAKGESIQDLVEKVKARVEFLNSDKQVLSQSIAFGATPVDNVPLLDVVEKESGLCAMARVLHEVKNNPENSLVKKGELATFILVSDEKEHDPQGLECVKSYQFQQPVPGYLHKAECVDTESAVSYKLPANKTVTVKVNKPYTRHIRQAYESIKDEVVKVDGKCDMKFIQSQARLKVNKNTHAVKVTRKIVDSNGNDVVSYWKHDLQFDRYNKKHDLNFARTVLSHKLTFDRESKKYRFVASRTLTSPKYGIDIQRQKIAKFQKVSYKRETILSYEGGKEKVVNTYTTATPIRIANVNFASASSCTESWLRAQQAVAELETPLESNLRYKYTVSQCVIDNTTTADNKVTEVVGVKPAAASCNTALAQAVYPEGALNSNESYNYTSVTCSDKTAGTTVNALNVVSAGLAPSACDPQVLDTAKPSVDTSKGETLSYTGVSCSDASTKDVAAAKSGLPGNFSAANLLDYIKGQDGDLPNTVYSNYSYANTPAVTNGLKIQDQAGVCPSSDLKTYIAGLESNPANTTYGSESCTNKEPMDNDVKITNIDGKYEDSSMGPLADYVKAKDSNKPNVRYDDLKVTNKATYKTENITITVDGKAPVNVSDCNAAYAESVDSAKPTLLQGELLVYTGPITCTNSSTALTLTRNSTMIKYDGSQAQRVVTYDSSLGDTSANGRNCSPEEKSAILANEASLSPTYFPVDGNKYEIDATNGCRVYNTDVTSATITAKTNILAKINGDADVKVSTSANACDAAITKYCSDASINTASLFCKQDSSTIAKYVPYVAYQPESRIYTLKAPVRRTETNELHWFGFQAIQTVDKNNQAMNVNLLNLKCSQVVSACDSASANMTVLDYFKQTYANGSDTQWQAISKQTNSSDTISDPLSIAACNGNLIPTHPKCNNKSVMVSDYVSYDTAQSDVAITVALDSNVSCEDTCTADSCKTKDGSSFSIPIAINGVTKKLKEFYGNNCAIGTYATTGEATRGTASINLNLANSDSAAYQNNADVCSLTCADSGLCKIVANGALDISPITVRQFLASKNQNIDASKITSCKIVRKAVEVIDAKRSSAEVDTACTRPLGVTLANKYVRAKQQYYDADPAPVNKVKLVKENEVSLESYVKSNFANVLGDGYVSMIAFASQVPDGADIAGADYKRVAGSVNGQVHDVKASSSEYGEALKFLGEKVAAQLASSFKVVDVAPSQQITRLWYSSWFTKGKFIELSPTDFSASANSFVITNPSIIEKMKNEAAFKFFVEIY